MYFCKTYDALKKVKHIITSLIWILAGLYLLLVILTHIPSVQHFIGSRASALIAEKIGSKVTIGRIDLGFLNRFIADDVTIYDQDGKRMLSATRISAKFDTKSLAQQRISISSVQLFGLNADLYKKTADSKPNFQFLIDSLASKDTTATTPLDLSINSLVVRNGKIRYNQLDAYNDPSRLSLQHLDVSNISGHLDLNILTDDSLNLTVSKLSFKEAKGLDVKSLHFKLVANKSHAELIESGLLLPNSRLSIDQLTAFYNVENGLLQMPSLTYSGRISGSSITPSDLACLDKALKTFNKPVNLAAEWSGTSTSVRVKSLNIGTADNSLQLSANGSISNWDLTPKWVAAIERLVISGETTKMVFDAIGGKASLPEEITRLGNIGYKGEIGGAGSNFSTQGHLLTDAGNAEISLGKYNQTFNGHIKTDGINLGHILDNSALGLIAANADFNGTTKGNEISDVTVKGVVDRIDYNGYSYNNLTIDSKLSDGLFDGSLSIEDPNATADISGTLDMKSVLHSANIIAHVNNIKPSALGLKAFADNATYSFDLNADLKGNTINTLEGTVGINDFSMKSAKTEYEMSNLSLNANSSGSDRQIEASGDFGNLLIRGRFDYTTLPQSLANLIGSRLPTLPGLPLRKAGLDNDFTISATVNRSDWLSALFDIPLQLNDAMSINGYVNDAREEVDMTVQMPDFAYNNSNYKAGKAYLATHGDSLSAQIGIHQISDEGGFTNWEIDANAADNKLYTRLSLKNDGQMNFSGTLNAETEFFKNERREAAAHVRVHTSNASIGDSTWTIHPSDIIYSKNRLLIDHFAIEHNGQHIIVSGLATDSRKDTLNVDLQDVDIAYMLNLINWHAVDFGGRASGYAYLSNLFSKPEAHANLMVKDFTFEGGRMGVLSADVTYGNDDQQINIDATAYDENNARTDIRGYVSPQRNYMDIGVYAHNTRGEFIEGFCGSFMRDVDVQVNGECHVLGDLSDVNLTGMYTVSGTVGISTLNTTYTLRNDTIRMIPNEIIFPGDSIYDRNGNVGVITGGLHHQSLRRLTYDINIATNNLLAYDFHDFGDDTFYGTVYATGTCDVIGRKGTLDFNVNATPNKGSFIVYNAASPTSINDQNFIHWIDRDSIAMTDTTMAKVHPITVDAADDIPTDIRLNMLVNTNPDFNLRVLMDESSGDEISLYGDGVIRASYYNKGSFDMFGTYNINYGTYDLTIQNIIKRDFEFQEGSSIIFGGDPTNALLNLKAQYVLNGVSLSDLNIGRSFTSNNIRVNCLMDIGGTAGNPKIDFNLDLPTVNSDVKQMVTSLINSEEEMNQQVLYLLAVGRFYSQGSNNAAPDGTSTQQSQTSLAMQSILSGQLSQQLNSILKTVVNNSNWNFGANISTGTEGFNNAEYEGLLSGRMLNNRLLFNGQFGYRDNANATTSFIGDFDLRYLIYPNGNLAIRVYNQTNDRYFTRNSLTTQGLGVILKKDFNGWRDFWGLNKKGKKKKKKDKKVDK